MKIANRISSASALFSSALNSIHPTCQQRKKPNNIRGCWREYHSTTLRMAHMGEQEEEEAKEGNDKRAGRRRMFNLVNYQERSPQSNQ
jgi:hypothetical protein